MKLITRCIISLETLEVISETSYEYSGLVTLCKGGGGGAGVVDFPVHMKDVHKDWLNKYPTDTIEKSMTEVMDSALGSSPWTATAYDPDADIAMYEGEVAAFAAILAGISDTVDWAALYTQAVTLVGSATSLTIADISVGDLAVVDKSVLDIVVVDKSTSDMVAVASKVIDDLLIVDKSVTDIAAPAIVDSVTMVDLAVADILDTADTGGITETEITNDVDAFADQLDDEISTKILPRFRRGMQDINAVVSSAFPLGEAIIYAFRDRDVSKHNSSIRLMAASKNADIEVENERLHLEVRKTNVGKDVEVGRQNSSIQLALASKNADIDISNRRLLLDVEQINLNKDVEVGRFNLMKDIETGKANLIKNVEIDRSNMLKDLEISKSNMMKNLEVDRINLSKDTEVSRSNLMKDVEVGKINLSKDIDISRSNLSKDVDIGKTNLMKDVQVGEITVKADAEYSRMYLEGSSQMLRLMLQRVSWVGDYTRLAVESARIKIVAKKEEADENADISKSDALWDLEVFQYGANLLAAIGGGTAVSKQPSKIASAIGGGLSGGAAGAVMGAQIGAAGGPIGAAGGAVIGGIIGVAAALFG